jgi:hypothetical protein
MPGTVRYLCSVRLDGVRRILLWESGDDGADHVVVDDRGMVLEFPSVSAARETRPPAGRVLSSEPATHYDFDTVQAWCASTADTLDCATLLSAWNLLGDLPHAENLFAWADVRAKGVYDKLFFGCNLPAITPQGNHYVPTWSAPEITALKRVLLLGLAELRARLSGQVSLSSSPASVLAHEGSASPGSSDARGSSPDLQP